MKITITKTGTFMLGVALAIMTTGLQAQRGNGMHSRQGFRADSGVYAHRMLNLTADQDEKITALRIVHQKEMMNLRNDKAIKQAELQKYRSADKPDMTQINKTIDELGKLTVEMQKKSVAHELAVRNLLTDEQKAVFTLRHHNREFGEGRGMRHSQGKEYSYGNRRGDCRNL
ncbi:MAG TPA: periplasmic heavy metal sensor [Bacteroidales bacterium]|nr:periplasmic heavy metal sensor [Bacteroidales bacterium]